ncbi:MAG: peptidoglycan-binding protein LysM, partial [Pseudomonadota bacterium]
PNTIVAISLGKREGMEEGHVLRIMRHVGESKDPVTKRMYKLPDEETGLLMIFRVFDKVSYALIMDATRPVHIHDALRTP